jgi:HSP20 family protein
MSLKSDWDILIGLVFNWFMKEVEAMSLMRMNPFSTLFDLQERLSKAFDEGSLIRRGEEELGLTGWRPAVDVFEGDDSYVIKAELPEVKREDVKIHLENNRLTISGERRMENEENRHNYHRIERTYGSFSRSFALPSDILPDQIKASFNDGMLKVTVPKTETAKPRTIEIGTDHEDTRAQKTIQTNGEGAGKDIKVQQAK